jgi:hypothetical protein
MSACSESASDPETTPQDAGSLFFVDTGSTPASPQDAAETDVSTVAASCTDGQRNGDESDVDCGGSLCAPCGLDLLCDAQRDCVSTLVCDAPADPVAGEKRCRYPKSCKELLAAVPDAPTGGYLIQCGTPEPVSLRCDMGTKGGGWTQVTIAAAHTTFEGEMLYTGDAAAAEAGFDDQHRPFTRDNEAAHSYHYTFAFPCGFTEFILRSYEAKANAGPGHASEIDANTFIQDDWTAAYGISNAGPPVAGFGDISFGSGDATGPVTSYAAQATTNGCESCVFTWPGPLNEVYSVGPDAATSFRIGWGEVGTEAEGWYPWWSGSILLR